MPDAAGAAAPLRWQDAVEADLRRRVLEKILGKLAQVYEGKPAPSHDLNRIATSFEQKMFNEASNKEDYLKKIALKLLIMERERSRQAEPELQQPNRIHAVHSGNSSTSTMTQVSQTMSIQERQSPHTRSLPITSPGSSPEAKQRMACPAQKINNKTVTMSDQFPKSSPAIVTASCSGIYSSQLRVQPGESQNQNKRLVTQMQPINISSGKETSVTQSNGLQVVQQIGQQNPLRQNARSTCMQPQQQMRMTQQCSEINPQMMNRKNSQMLIAGQANDAKMQTGHPRHRNTQQNVGLNVESPLQTYKHIKMEPQPLITDNQECNLQSVIPQTVASMGIVEDDWREEMFQQMKALKDAYLSELVELDQISAVPKITKEHFESLPKDKAAQYRFRVYMKKRIRVMMSFLQLQKNNIPEHLKGQLPMFVKAIDNVLGFYRRNKDQREDMSTGHQSNISPNTKPQIINLTDDPAQSNSCTSGQQNPPMQTAAFQLRQNTVTRTPSASRENHSNILLGVASSCGPMSSSGSALSLPSNRLQDYRTPSPVTKESPVKVPSSSAKSIISSPVGKKDSAIGSSPPVPSSIAKPDLKVASTFPSAVSRENNSYILLGVASSCDPMSSSGSAQSLQSNRLQDYRTPSPVTKESPVKVPSSSASVKSIISSPVGKKDSATGSSPPLSSSIAKPHLKVASPFPSAKSKLPSPVAMFSSQAALPCTLARSTSPSRILKAGTVKVSSPPSLVSTLPLPIETVGVAQSASSCSPLKPALSGDNSEIVVVPTPCPSMKSTSSESIEIVSALLQQNNVSAASNGYKSNLLMPSSVIVAEATDLKAEDLQHDGAERPVAKKPIDRLIDAVNSLSSAAVMSSANSICSVISMDDCVPHRELNTFQHWTFSKQAASSPPNKVKRIFEITALGTESPPLADTWDVEANVEHAAKRQKPQNARNALLDEIESANRMLIDTITSIADDSSTDGIASRRGGTLIKLSYTAMSVAPDLKSLFATSETPIVMPTKLLVPIDYPRSSPVLVNDQKGEQLRNIFSDISSSADIAFRNTLNKIPEPRSIRETARVWDTCVRRAVTEFAQRLGGGTFSSSYGRWESLGGA